MGIVSAVVGVVLAVGGAAAAVGAVGAGAGVIGAGAMLSAVVYGGASLLRGATTKKKGALLSSPTYQFGVLQTQTNNQLPLALIYGENKLAGNRLWQRIHSDNTVIDRIVAFGEGEITSVSDIRLNDIPASESGAMVRVYSGAGGQLVDDMVPGDTQLAKIQAVGSLRHVAYVAVSLKANENIRSDYNLTALVKGRKVRVYSDCDTYTVQYSNNPAWCLLDFLMGYNACAIGLSENGVPDDALVNEFIDIESFIEAANYCDESVNGKPRFTFNMIVDVQSPRRDIIEEFKKSCRGALVIKGKKLQLKIDKGSEPIKTIFKTNIIAESERFWSTPREENYDRIIVKYRSAQHDWAIVEAVAEQDVFDNVPPVEHTVDIYCVTDHQQASRLAWYYLNKVKLERYFGYFETDYRAFDIEIGDVIILSDNLMNYVAKKVKVTKLVDNNDGTFGVYWREYNEALYTDAMGSLEPTVAVSQLENIYAHPPCPKGFSVAQALNTVQFSWNKVDGVDVTYEIREGESWELSSPVLKEIAGARASLSVFSSGLKKYFIKAKSAHSIFSEESASDSLYVGDIAATNLVFDEDLISEDAYLAGGYSYQNHLKPTPIVHWGAIGDEPELWGGQPYFAQSGFWGCMDVASASLLYDTPVFDIGATSQCIVGLNYNLYNPTQSAITAIEWATSDDGSSWSPLKNFCEGSHKFRYFMFRVTIQNPLGKQFSLSDLSVSVDVPDRDEYYCDVVIEDAQAGVTIDFATHPDSSLAQPFIKIPAVVSNISGAQQAYCVTTNKSVESATIKAFDYEGNPVAASIDVRVRGF